MDASVAFIFGAVFGVGLGAMIILTGDDSEKAGDDKGHRDES
jgi:hypothetical protein